MIGCSPMVLSSGESAVQVGENIAELINTPMPTVENTVVPTDIPTPTLVPTQTEAEVYFSFPYVDQVGEDAPYIDDCGSSAVMMVAKYYGLETVETVEEHHKDMARGDFPTTFKALTDYLDEKYGLQTKVVTNNKYTIPALEERGYDVSEIEFITTEEVEAIQNDRPMIWAYALEAHWVVRYKGWNFDPNNGIFLFKLTEIERHIITPDLGLGIIVIEGGD